MSHNKMYREIEGYEDALYLTSDLKDELDELYYKVQHGESKENIKPQLDKIDDMMNQIKVKLS